MYNKKKKGRIRLLAGMVAVLLLAGSGLGYVQAENTESRNGQSSQELEETYQNWEIQDVDESLSENSGDDLASDLEAAAEISEIPEEIEDVEEVMEETDLLNQQEADEEFSDENGEIHEHIEDELADPDLKNEITAVTEGKAIISSGSEYRLVTAGSEVYKGNYNLLGDSNNRKKFVFVPFNNAGNDVAYLEVGGVIYFVPRNMNAAGKYGFLVQNVGFNSE